jgi:DNA adenine methylase
MPNKMFRPPFKTQGGKYYLASWILGHFPENYEKLIYIELYSGAASVLLNKSPSETEVICDTNLGIIQIFRALRDEPNDFIGRLRRTKYSEGTFERAISRVENPKDYLDYAVGEYILRRMSWGGMKQTYAKPKPNQDLSKTWKGIIQELPRIADRVAHIHIFHRPAFDVIKSFDDDEFLCYCDPPILDDDVAANEHSMPAEDHVKLADMLRGFRGKVLISGRCSKLYKRLYEEWKCVRKKVANADYLWMNY